VKLSSAEAILGLAAAIVAIAGGALAAYRGLAAMYGRTVGSRRRLSKRLNQLAGGVTIRWVEDRLGGPAFVREFKTTHTASWLGHRELVYRNKHAWIQILADEHDAVVRFSVTVTDPKFRFQISDLTSGQLNAKLGRTSFSSVQTPLQPLGRSRRVGAHNFEYAEAYWFGNPGNYQWYVFSYNDVGTGHFDMTIGEHGTATFQDGILRPSNVTFPESDFQAEAEARFRAKTTINTLTVLGPGRADRQHQWLGLTSLAEPRGPDSNHVRVLLPGARERRQRRRRISSWNRRVLRETGHLAEEAPPNETDDLDERRSLA
jgi:hypothetical protein